MCVVSEHLRDASCGGAIQINYLCLYLFYLLDGGMADPWKCYFSTYFIILNFVTLSQNVWVQIVGPQYLLHCKCVFVYVYVYLWADLLSLRHCHYAEEERWKDGEHDG